MSTTEAQLIEVFGSIQGEGLYVGEKQIFIRFAGCNLNCSYCDSVDAREIPKEFKFEVSAGGKEYKKYPNPATAAQLLELVKSLDKPQGNAQAISLTGGEPLLQVDFLKNFIPQLKKEVKLPVYLETNGTLPDHLTEIIDLVDIIAMDIKISGEYLKEHKKFLETAFLKEVFVKVVFTKESKIKELEAVLALIASVAADIPLVLQPVTPHGPVKHRPAAEQIFAFYNLARRKLNKVKVIPQTQAIFGVK